MPHSASGKVSPLAADDLASTPAEARLECVSPEAAKAVAAEADMPSQNHRARADGSCYLFPAFDDESGRCSAWAAGGQWHWHLANVRPLADPVPCKGALGLWHLSDEVEKAVRAQLGEDGKSCET